MLPVVHLLQIPTDQTEQTCTNTKSSFKQCRKILPVDVHRSHAAGTNSDAFDIDLTVSVVGQSVRAEGEEHAFILPGLLKLDNLLEGSCQFIRHNNLVQSGRWNHPAMKVLTEGEGNGRCTDNSTTCTHHSHTPHITHNMQDINPHIHSKNKDTSLPPYFFSLMAHNSPISLCPPSPTLLPPSSPCQLLPLPLPFPHLHPQPSPQLQVAHTHTHTLSPLSFPHLHPQPSPELQVCTLA